MSPTPRSRRATPEPIAAAPAAPPSPSAQVRIVWGHKEAVIAWPHEGAPTRTFSYDGRAYEFVGDSADGLRCYRDQSR